jgi:hypothetical protein
MTQLEQDLAEILRLIGNADRYMGSNGVPSLDDCTIAQQLMWNLFRQHGPALQSALADQRRLRDGVRGECIACDFTQYERPTWHVIDDRDAVPLTLRGRVAIVPLDQEGE